MICFFCALPYQVITCLNMALFDFKDKKKCLVLFNAFKGYKDVYDVCKASDIFEEVIIVKSDFDINWIQNWNRRYHYFFLYNSLSRLCKKFIFDKIIFFIIDPLNVSHIIKKVLNKNPKCEVCIAEDGIGSYLSNKLYLPSEKQLFWFSLLELKKYYEKISYLYLLYPEFLAYKPAQTVRKISKKGFETPEFQKFIAQMFECRKIPKCDYLLLQQPLAQEKEDLKTISDSQERLFQILDSKVKGKSSYIKLHPRTKSFIRLDNCIRLEQNSPFETMIDENINSSTIVTVFSTAAFTPYMLFSFTPRIILLYRLCDNFIFADDMNKFLKVFVKKYKEEHAEIYIPETIEEFEKLLEV